MGRIIGLILVALGAAGVIIWLTTIEGSTRVEFNGKVMDPPTAALLGLALVVAVLLVFGTTIFGYLARLPARLRARGEAKQHARGMTALTRGLEAVAAGDADDAQHHARLANKNLDNLALTRLLTAQAAQLAGDDDTARDSYAAMLEAPETEFLGLRGLYLQAMHRGDKDQAKGYADRAFRLRPNAAWAFDSVYALSVERGQWGDAHEALRLAQKQGTPGTQAAERKSAALLAARAFAARDAGDGVAAREDAEAALKHDAGLAPAAILAARLEAEAGKKSKAAKTLEAAWAKQPHPAIPLVMREIFAEVGPNRRIARLRKLVAKNPDHPESQLLAAEVFIEDGEPDEARALLEPLLLDRPTARTFAVMAEAVQASSGKSAAEPWLERAAAAPRDPVPGASGEFDLTTEGWKRLVLEYGDHGRLAPPPLEVVETGLAREELLALTAPTAVSEAPDASETPEAPAAEDQADVEIAADTEDEADIVVAEPVVLDAPAPVPARADAEPPVSLTAGPATPDGAVDSVAESDLAAPKKKRRFGDRFRTSGAEADALIDDAVGPEMRDEAITPAGDAKSL